MPQAKPEDRPGTKLSPLDHLERRGSPKPTSLTGKIEGFYYAAWRYPDGRGGMKLKVLFSEDGHHLVEGPIDRFHRVDSEEEIPKRAAIIRQGALGFDDEESHDERSSRIERENARHGLGKEYVTKGEIKALREGPHDDEQVDMG